MVAAGYLGPPALAPRMALPTCPEPWRSRPQHPDWLTGLVSDAVMPTSWQCYMSQAGRRRSASAMASSPVPGAL